MVKAYSQEACQMEVAFDCETACFRVVADSLQQGYAGSGDVYVWGGEHTENWLEAVWAADQELHLVFQQYTLHCCSTWESFLEEIVKSGGCSAVVVMGLKQIDGEIDLFLRACYRGMAVGATLYLDVSALPSGGLWDNNAASFGDRLERQLLTKRWCELVALTAREGFVPTIHSSMLRGGENQVERAWLMGLGISSRDDINAGRLLALRRDYRKGSVFDREPLRRPKVMIYNSWLDTLGGGERSTIDLALALSDLGFIVHFGIVREREIPLEPICEAFGAKKRFDWKVRRFDSEEAMAQDVRSQCYDIFVNHTFGSSVVNAAALGIYMMMFPTRDCFVDRAALSSYGLFVCNSEYTALYIRSFLGIDNGIKVLPPPISNFHLDKEAVRFEEKEKVILNVGRFNVRGHNKCQLEVIKCFLSLVEQGDLDGDWKLFVAGRVNDSDENRAYFGQCEKLARGTNVTVLRDVSAEELVGYYRRASVLWQFTGIGIDYGVTPELCEHLGLVALDCFAYGVVPIAYDRGGINWIVDYGINGFSFSDTAGLGDVMRHVADVFGGTEHRMLFQGVQETAEQFSFQQFRDKIEMAVACMKGVRE